MTVSELIAELGLCNPGLPVLFEVEAGAQPVGGVEFASYKETEFADYYTVGHGDGNRCALIRLYPSLTEDEPERLLNG